MKIDELVKSVSESHPKLLEGIPAKKAAALVRGAFAGVASALENMDEGVFTVAGFGRFRVRQVEREVAGEKAVTKRVTFRTARGGGRRKKEAADQED